MKRLIITFLFITHSLFGQSNFQTSLNKNGLLSIEPKNHVAPEQLNQNLIIGNSSSVFWVEPRIRDNYEPPALPIIERSNNDWCGTMPWWEERNSGQRSCDYHGITDDPTVRDTYIPNTNTETIFFRLFFHAFADDNGNNPTTTLADAEAQLLSLNDIFSSYNIQFYAWLQIHNDSQFQSLTSAQWSSGEIKETYAMDPTIYHNAYVADSDSDWGILGVSTFPWDSEALTVYGGTFIDKDWFGGPRSFSGTADVPNHTATHEFGHALGLWHTHHGVDEVDVCSSCYEGADGYTYATGDSADVVGDLCSDTKATSTNFTCADPDTFDCQGNSWVNTDVHNFMGYADDDCYNLNNDGFSSQQSGRMHGWITDRYEGIIVNSEEMALLSVGFEAGLPNDWTVIDDDSDGYQWGFYYDNETFDMSHYGAAGGAVYNYSATNSDYLITPFIDIPSNVATATFSFWAKSHSSSYPEDFVARISTDGTNFTSLGSTSSASSDWTQYSYDISSYIGQSVYLALHCVSTWGHYLMADDFLVSASLNALPLDAEFSASFTTGTAPITIDFTDLSAGSPTSWSWTFGDGGTSTLQNPTHTFQYAGLYTVSLVVSDGTDSSTETKTGYINIAEPGAVTLLTESFETSLPSDWTVIDNDADGNQWSRYNDDGYDGSISMGVQWNSTGNDDWLITPQLSLTANSSISFSFWARSLSSLYLEDFNVKLATASNSISDFTTIIGSVVSTPYGWTEYEYDLSEYSGQSIYLAVQCVSVDQYYLFVDDFELVCDPIPPDLFFSEWIEGSSFNKAIELFNPTEDTIWLDNYAFPNVTNNPTTTGEYEYWNTFDAGAYVLPAGVFVLAHPDADSAVLQAADMTSHSYFSNGDDGFGLAKGTEASYTVIDWIGDWEEDPGSGWDVAGVSAATKDHTIIRKPDVIWGNISWSASAGTDSANSEWTVHDQNYFDNLGFHLSPYSFEHIVITNDNLVVLEDSSSTIDLLDNDLIVGITSFTFTLAIVDSADNGTIALVGDTALTYTPNANFFGYDTVSYRVFSSESVDTGLVFITVTAVNDAPVASAGTVTTNEDIEYSGILSASDVDGDTLTYSVYSNPSHGSVSLNSSNTGTSLSFDGVDDYVEIPTLDLSSGDDITISAWIRPDEGSLSSTRTWIRQNPNSGNPNWLMQFSPSGPKISCGLNTSGGYDELDVNIIASDFTDGSHHLVLTYDGTTKTLYKDGNLIGSNSSNSGNINYNSSALHSIGRNPTGSEYFDGAVDEIAIWDDALMAVEVMALYNSGYGLSASSNSGAYTSSSSLKAYWIFNEGSGITLTDQTTNGNNGTIYGATWDTDNGVSSTSNNIFTYSPTTNYNGSDSFVYSASDGTLSDTATVSITINAVDDTPVASNDTVTVSEDTDYSGTLIASDGDGDALTFSIIDSTVNGTLTLSDPATGTFTYSPLANFNGSDSLLFSASDGILLDTGSVTIVVTTIDDLPVVANPLPDITVNEDASDTTLGDLKNVFLDVDEELIYSHAVNDTGLVFVSVTNDTVTLQFLADANGSTEIVFTATNPTTRASVSDTALLTVLPMNDAPEIISAFPDTSMVEDETLSLTIQVYDMDGDSLTIYGESDTGAVNVNWDGELITMTSAVDWNGSAGITVIVMDDSSAGDTANFTLTVEPANDPPEEFSVIYPTVSDTFSTHSDNDTLIQFTWGKSNDIDSDITYNLTIELEFFGNTYTDIHENISDTTISVSSNSLDPMLNVISEEEAGFTYYVHASDDEYNVASDVGEFVLSRAALGAVDGYAIPDEFALHQNYPNPFNPVTTLRYDLPETGLVTITIYDMLGREVKTLINQTQDAGYRSVLWNATNDYGKPVSAGIYLYQIQAGEYMQTKKMVLLK